MFHRFSLDGKLDVNYSAVQNHANGMTKSFIAKGFPPNIAHENALQSLNYMITKQAMVLPYMDVFWFIGLTFFICFNGER